MIDFSQKHVKKTLGILIILVVSFLCWRSYSLDLITHWESPRVFKMFQSTEKAKIPSLRIQKGGNTGGCQYEHDYAHITIQKYILQKLHLNTSIRNIRGVSFVFGALALCVLFMFLLKQTSFLISLASTLLLGTLPIYVAFQNVLFPQIAVVAFCALILYFSQSYLERPLRKKNLYIFALALLFAITSTSYLIGRLFMVIIYGILLLNSFIDFRTLKLEEKKDIQLNLFSLFKIFILHVLILGIFKLSNIPLFFSPEFLFSPLGEYMTGESASFLTGLFKNLIFLVKYLMMGLPYIDTQPSSFMAFGDGRVSLFSLSIFLIFSLGFLISLSKKNMKKNLLIMITFFGMVLMLLMSQIYIVMGEESYTLSTYRSFCLVLFLPFFSYLAFEFIYKKNRTVCIVAVVILLGVNVSEIIKNNRDFSDLMKNKSTAYKSLDGPEGYEVRRQTGYYFEKPLLIYRISNYIHDVLKNDSERNKKKIFFIDQKKLRDYKYKFNCGIYLNSYLKTFINIYLQEHDYSLAYFEKNRVNTLSPNHFIAVSREEVYAFLKYYHPEKIQVYDLNEQFLRVQE